MPRIADLIAAHIVELRAARPGRRLIVGVCGAQGSGKSTVAAQAVEQLARSGVAATVLSLDDLYLTKLQRAALAETVHPLLAVRGPPGTHDIDALDEILEHLRTGEAAGSPTFDKLADDRATEVFDRQIEPVDVVVLEGWCIGAEPQSPAQLAAPINALERGRDGDGRWRSFVNEALAGRYRDVFEKLDGLVFLRAPDFGVVAHWRLEQEQGARSIDGAARPMSPDGIAAFVQHYERITRRMLEAPPKAVTLMLALDEKRRLIDAKPSPAPHPENR